MKSLLVFTIALLGSVSQAAIYDYSPDSRLYMGGGFNPYKPTSGYLNCVEFDAQVSPDNDNNPNATYSSSVDIKQIKSRTDFYSFLNFSTSVSGSYSFMGGSASYSLLDERAFHSDSLTFMVLFKNDYGRFVLKNPRLKSEYKNLEQTKLVKTCGTEIVTEMRKGVMAYALFTIKNVNQSQRREIEAKLSASAGGSFWSASMDMNYKSVLRTALQASDISVSVRALGGTGIVDLNQIIGGSNDEQINLDKIPTILSQYVEKFRVSNAVPTQYTTTDIQAFRSDVSITTATFDQLTIGELFSTYEDFSSIIGRLQKILYGSDSTAYDLTPQVRMDLEDKLLEYSNYRRKIKSAALLCLTEGEICEVPPMLWPQVQWPRPRPNLRACVDMRDQAAAMGLLPQELYRMAEKRNLVPLIAEDGMSIEGWTSCEDFIDQVH
ncbi:MAG TPA: hypothetical protein DCL41_04105 [Bdellovibrionales bacterium]|nr:hypothetical protein [Pseudobdellovibrionaceae bacterium]HAG91027.1 hypothetical protein [Bdellovibrionales bacterium]|tara:strand:+ start:37143 stop:38450 length:1308 start_codon:yes stop_codon:yes gene_type:complete